MIHSRVFRSTFFASLSNIRRLTLVFTANPQPLQTQQRRPLKLPSPYPYKASHRIVQNNGASPKSLIRPSMASHSLLFPLALPATLRVVGHLSVAVVYATWTTENVASSSQGGTARLRARGRGTHGLRSIELTLRSSGVQRHYISRATKHKEVKIRT